MTELLADCQTTKHTGDSWSEKNKIFFVNGSVLVKIKFENLPEHRIIPGEMVQSYYIGYRILIFSLFKRYIVSYYRIKFIAYES